MSSSQESSGTSRKRPRLEEPFRVPVLHESCDAVEDLYRRCQALYIQKAFLKKHEKDDDTITWKHLGALFQSLNDKDRDSWCIENGSDVQPSDFLKCTTQGYASFLIQKDVTALERTLKRLPISELPLNDTAHHEACLWFFVGVNNSSDNNDSVLHGRPEHTDSVSHDGTWHYQLCGSKHWYLRPTDELLRLAPKATSVSILVQEGDVLVVNTRVWWHRTEIPIQATPCISYARDFHLSDEALVASNAQMTNVDGLYAPHDLEENTIIFTEHNMPDCELPHADLDKANCRVVDLDDGNSALISSRFIPAGEFFCCLAGPDDDTSDEEITCDNQDEEASESGDDK